MKKTDIDYDLTKSMISQIKEEKGRRIIKEDKEETAIPITNDAKFGQNVLKNQIDAFKKAVNGGAKFAQENSSDAESNPLVYYPKSGNLVFSGSIPSISDIKFQFSLNDVTNAPYIFVEGLALTEDTLNVLNKLRGYFLNWKEEWYNSEDLLSQLKKGDN